MKLGDIISFRQGQSVITHRITAVIEEDGKTLYKTKGDNNNAEDSGEITEDLIEGKVIKIIPFVGKIALLLEDKIIIVIILILLYIYLSHSGAREKKRRARREKRIMYEKNNKE